VIKDHLVYYAKYNLWANRRVHAFIRDHLSEEQTEKEIVSSFSSVKKTILHILDAEMIWLERFHGNSLNSFPSQHFKGSGTEAAEALVSHSKKFLDFISSKEPSFFDSSLKYKNLKGVAYETNASDVVQHVMNHNTFHRGQLITMFRQLGFSELFSTDYINFTREP